MKITILLTGLMAFVGGCTMLANDEADQCGASQMQELVGRSVDEVNVMTDLPEKTRVIMPRMGVTKDLRLERLNIYIDPNNKVHKVVCG